MRFQAFLFDLDGTLIDHFAAIHRCYAGTLTRLGLPVPTPAQVRAAVGGGLENALRNFVPEARLAEALVIYREIWDRTMLDDVALMPGALDLLQTLRARGAAQAVITNKLGPSSRLICDRLGITPLVRAVVGAGDTPWLKPKREMTDHVLEKLGVPASAALLVGDSPYDIQTAHNAGLPAWCVSTGTHTSGQLQSGGADAVFDNLAALGRSLSISPPPPRA